MARTTTAAAPASQEPWRNRIVGEGTEDPSQLLANPMNPRIHPFPQQEALAGVLDEVGWVQRVVVNQRTQHVVDGHLRVALAISRNEPAVPVVYVDLNEAEERLVLAALDPISGMAGYDAGVLDQLLREVETSSPALQQMLSDLADKANPSSLLPAAGDADQSSVPDLWGVVVTCGDESVQAALLERLQAEGYTVRALLS